VPVILKIFIGLFLLALAVLIALSYRKKRNKRDMPLREQTGVVDSELSPDGSILVSGELWDARSNSGATIPSRARVRVVGFDQHVLLVEQCD
jgi:membrane-bound ClpP family serine protease